MAEEFLCARCARHQRTCCQDSEIHVSLADVRRIQPFASREEFTEFRAPTDPVYDQRIEDPFWHQHVFRPDGTRRVLKQQRNGDCFFLGPAGCRLPAECRPIVCRLYPFDYTADGLMPRPASGCPLELLPPGSELLPALGMNSSEAERLRAQLYDEIRES
jgi:Fe-S-cluster containining protein